MCNKSSAYFVQQWLQQMQNSAQNAVVRYEQHQMAAVQPWQQNQATRMPRKAPAKT
jgi:hypothetical protein